MKRHSKQSIYKVLVEFAKKRKLRLAVVIAAIIIFFIVLLEAAALLYNNKSFHSDEAFADSLDESIGNAKKWVLTNKQNILEQPNIALLKMIDECDKMSPDTGLSEMVHLFMSGPSRPACWKALIDPNRPINSRELNNAIAEETIDNKWTLYAIGQNQAEIKPEETGLYDKTRWHGRKLTHQLWALVHLRDRTKNKDDLNQIVEYLSDRIAKEIVYDFAVVDIYIQKIAFVLRAGYPEKIKRRWVERVISNQENDGGWNDKWFIFTSSRKPAFGQMPSDAHATIQALWLLYQVKYKYPEQFGLAGQKNSPSTKPK